MCFGFCNCLPWCFSNSLSSLSFLKAPFIAPSNGKMPPRPRNAERCRHAWSDLNLEQQDDMAGLLSTSKFPSCYEPHYGSEVKCKVLNMKLSFHSYANKTKFHMKRFAVSLASIMRFTTTWKWSNPCHVLLDGP